MKKIVVIIVLAGALVFGALNYHFILLDSDFKILKKESLTFSDTYVDARGANKLKILAKPALIKAGIKDVLKNAK